VNRGQQKAVFPHPSLPTSHFFVKTVPEGILLQVRVLPRARKTTWAGVQIQELKLKVQAPPVEGSVNQHCLSFLSHWFGLKRSEVVLVKGGKSRSKVFLLKGITLEKCLSLIPDQNPDPRESEPGKNPQSFPSETIVS
jgi:uncharacterized protein (TIGR00251 family)